MSLLSSNQDNKLLKYPDETQNIGSEEKGGSVQDPKLKTLYNIIIIWETGRKIRGQGDCERK